MTHWPIDAAVGFGAAPLLLGSIAAEITASATATQRRAFFRAVGTRIAVMHPVEDAQDIDSLATAINRIWHDHDCGEVLFELVEDGLLITHTGLGRQLSGTLGNSTEQVLRPMLEGAYDAWLHTLGSGKDITTRTLWWSDTEARLKHGR